MSGESNVNFWNCFKKIVRTPSWSRNRVQIERLHNTTVILTYPWLIYNTFLLSYTFSLLWKGQELSNSEKKNIKLTLVYNPGSDIPLLLLLFALQQLKAASHSKILLSSHPSLFGIRRGVGWGTSDICWLIMRPLIYIICLPF